MTTSVSKSAPCYFQTAKPAYIRLSHWPTFSFFTIYITPVIFELTLFKTNNNIDMVQQVQEKGGVVTED